MHEHIAAVVATEAARRQWVGDQRLLDAGCGDGALLEYALVALAGRPRETSWWVAGFDVHDQQIQPAGFLAEAVSRLAARHPDVPWHERLRATTTDARWPFPDSSFDVVVSNQVGEHVADLGRFFSEVARVLRPGGFSVHVFPLQDYILEGHLLLPLVHRVLDHDSRAGLIRVLSRVGLGKFRHEQDKSADALDRWSERHADYLWHLTAYRSWPQVAAFAKQAGLRASYRFTPDLYLRKLLKLVGRPMPLQLRVQHRWPLDVIAFHLCKRVSSVTLVLEAEQAYRAGGGGHR